MKKLAPGFYESTEETFLNGEKQKVKCYLVYVPECRWWYFGVFKIDQNTNEEIGIITEGDSTYKRKREAINSLQCCLKRGFKRYPSLGWASA